MDNLNEQRTNLDGFCKDTVKFISDLVNKIQQSIEIKIKDFALNLKHQLNLQQKNFKMIKNYLDFNKTFDQIKLQVKTKIDLLQKIEQQLNDLNSEILVKNFVKPNAISQYVQEIEQFNNNLVQQGLDLSSVDQENKNKKDEKIVKPVKWFKQLIYTCKVCQKVFRGLFKYRCHKKFMHDVKYFYQCGYCKQQFRQTVHIAQHCFELHTNQGNFQDRPEAVHARTVYLCPYTNKKFTQYSQLAHYIRETLQYHVLLPDDFGLIKQVDDPDVTQNQNEQEIDKNIIQQLEIVIDIE